MDIMELLFETIPVVIVVSLSSIILFIQGINNCKTCGYQELSSKDTGDIPIGSTRFSTIKRDVTKIVIILLQIGLFGLLFYLRYEQDENDNFFLSIALVICWFYALILTVVSITSGSRKWGWIINTHLTVFYVTATFCSLLQIRTALYSHVNSITFPKLKRIQIWISLTNFILSSIITLIAITTPKGPPLINNNRPVFAIEYCSLWDFIMFNTVNQLMKKAYYQPTFNDSDFDQLPYSLRTSTLYNDFKRWRDHSLLYRIVKANKKVILLQTFFTIISGILYYSPFAFLYRFIEFVQDYQVGDRLEWGLIYVFGMLLSNVVLQLSVAQVWYWSSCILQVAIKGQLNSVIYSKSLKRHDSHVTSLFVDDNEDEKKDDLEDSEKDEGNDNATVGKITNLMAVDSNRISEFATWWSSIIDCPIELCVGFYFLYQLLGSSCLYGLLMMVFTLPINHQTAKSYSKTQDKLMKARDRRVDLMNEVLQGIRMIKFYAWEKNWENRILDSRKVELKQLRNTYIYLTMFDLVWIVSPVLVTIASFYIFTKIQEHELTASIAFTSLSIFYELRFALNILPEVFMDGSQAYVSLKRIEKFLNEDEIADSGLESGENILGHESKISFEDATVTWNRLEEDIIEEQEFKMKNLNLEFPIGKLSIICGPTGSGKTLLLMSLLGETHVISGKVNFPKSPTDPINYDLNPSNWILPNSVALVSQQAWLQNASIRSNVIFGLPYDEERYEAVIKMCSLEKDLEIFEDGDMTEIGEKGITLSGGQKQRVSLARAVYSRAKHILMDDVLSAVDAHTAKHLMNNCILGSFMKGRTIILVTHHIRLGLSGASYLVAMGNGKITVAGAINDLKSSGKLNTILEEADSRSEDVNDSAELAAENVVKDDADNVKLHHVIGSSTASSSTMVENAENEVNLDNVQKTKKKIPKKPKVLVEEEARPTGAVRLRIYKTYVRANGHIIFWSLVVMIYIINRTTQIMESWWLKVWSTASIEDDVNNNYTSIHENSPFITAVNITPVSQAIIPIYSFNQQVNRILSARILSSYYNNDSNQEYNEAHSLDYYLNIYILINLLSSVFGVAKFTILYYGGLKASKKLYKVLLHQVLRAPLRFFDTTPVGRILNRFSKDFETIDSKLSGELSWFITNILMTITTTFVITAITKEFIAAAMISGVIYVFVGILYTKASRECKRLDSVTRSPLYSHFTETLIGIATIRAYGATKRFMQYSFDKIDTNHRAYFNMWIINRWLSIRYNLTGAFVAFFAGIFLLYNINTIDSGLAGLSLSFALNFSEQIMWTIRRYSLLEMSFNAVERVCEFSELPQEAPAIISPRPPAAWPFGGKIKVENLAVKYAEDLEPVLHNISFCIRGGEKVGIVGRTGSGKSTIALSLFRFVEPSNGKISIDGIDISSIGVEDLRSRITIIPQDPILFSGTIRSNLDAFSQYEDFEILSSLKRVHLIPSELEQITASDASSSRTLDRRGSVGGKSLMSRRGSRSSNVYDNINVFKDLDTPVSEGGKNFSQGQRQLLCLARALLRSSKVILMDEATASIDFATDEKIQQMIRTEFVDCTILCIAHRLRTIIDYDRILVLDQGNIIEFDSPHNLITNHESLFYKMCQNSGEFDQLMSLALKKGNKDV
ncbi:P-loop containing nucleoside triphosphate hydrolase protein [Glomus cerebriforme]|uniref:P-loop containing nucleoside triphosphate hydrolase protein n=1 Tax=Glomus cerebriforme TaxID=658196 RepID=A0A397SR64_9GLOM|nr:P-loop containing nucleoside triphosphate hydrolase protein [Glomus cerebriforme]